MSDIFEGVRKVVAETLPKIHWEIWQLRDDPSDWYGGIDGYLYRQEISRYGPDRFEVIEARMIEDLRQRHSISLASEPS